jgi:ABC-type glycerol-3-phosphate transport system substrate-binding protein
MFCLNTCFACSHARSLAAVILLHWLRLGMSGVLLLSLAACSTPGPLPVTHEPPATSTRTPAALAPTPLPSRTAAALLSPQPLPTSALGVKEADLKGLVVQLWHPWSQEPGGILQALAAEFSRTNAWGIQVQVRAWDGYDDLESGVQAALAARQPPDIVAAYAHQARAWDGVRPLVDLDDYLNDPQWGLSPLEQADFYPASWQSALRGSQRIGVPALRSAQVLYYNRTWARELGYESPPATSEALRLQACASMQANAADADPGNDRSGGLILSTDYAVSLGWLAAFGAEIVRRDGHGYQMDTPAVRSTLAFLRQLYDEGCAWLPEEAPAHQAFAQRRGLFMAGSLSALAYQQSLFSHFENGDTWEILPFPGPFGEGAIAVYGASFSIFSSHSPRQLAAWLFVRYLLEAEQGQRLVQAAGSLPLRAAASEGLQAYAQAHPQWAQAVAHIALAYGEPGLASWKEARWALGDATTQLFRSYFTIDQVPQLSKLLQTTVFDLYQQNPEP